MTRFCVLTGHDRVYRHLAAWSEPNKRAYADRHGYVFHAAGPADYPPDRPPSWYKIPLARAALTAGGCEWVFWSDADSLIMDPARPLESFLTPTDLAVFGCETTAPAPPLLNCGVFLLKAARPVVDFLDLVWNWYRPTRPPGCWEQDAVNALAPDHPGLIRPVPMRAFNAPPAYSRAYGPPAGGSFQAGDFLVHPYGSWQRTYWLETFARLASSFATTRVE